MRPVALSTRLVALLAALAGGPAGLAAADVSPFGVNIHAPESERLAPLLDRVVEAHLGWVRIDFVWAAVEPEPGVERWRTYDAIAAAARERGLAVLAILAYTPAWATDGPEIAGVPRDVADWADFCHRAANPDARIGGPGLAHHVASGRDWPGWLRDVLVEAGDELDFLSHHAYDLEDPVGVLRRLLAVTPFGREPSRWGEVEPSLREVLEWTGFDRPVWLTETGWVTTRLDESRQAELYARFLELWLGAEPPLWPERVFFYELQDDPDPNVPNFGLLRVSGRRKPAFSVLRDYAAAHGGAGEGAEPPLEPEDEEERPHGPLRPD